MADLKNSKITTIKLKKETKDRLDHLKEYERESYEEILRKVLYILNTLRGNPDAARSILKSIDFKLARTRREYQSIPNEKSEESINKIAKGKIPINLRVRKFRK